MSQKILNKLYDDLQKSPILFSKPQSAAICACIKNLTKHKVLDIYSLDEEDLRYRENYDKCIVWLRYFCDILDPKSPNFSAYFAAKLRDFLANAGESIDTVEMYISLVKDRSFVELCPGKWAVELQQERDSLRQESMKKIGNTMAKCRECGKRNANVELVQMRSADEPMTECYTCLECGYAWKR